MCDDETGREHESVPDASLSQFLPDADKFIAVFNRICCETWKYVNAPSCYLNYFLFHLVVVHLSNHDARLLPRRPDAVSLVHLDPMREVICSQSLGNRSDTNAVGKPYSNLSGKLIILIFCLLHILSRSLSLVYKSLFWVLPTCLLKAGYAG